MPDICLEGLKQRRHTENRLRLAAGEAWANTGLVLTTGFGDPIDPRNFQRAFRSSVRRAGVPVIPVHSTRRTCASLLVALDVHPRVAMAILRHSKIAVTMDIYSHVMPSMGREAAAQLGMMLYSQNP